MTYLQYTMCYGSVNWKINKINNAITFEQSGDFREIHESKAI